MKRFVWLLLCALSIAAVPAAAQSDIRRISVITDAEGAAAQGDIARSVQQALQQARPELAVEITDNIRFTPSPAQPTLIIALGDALLPWLSQHHHDYVGAIAFYVSAAAFTPHNKNTAKLTALYRDQPLTRQLDLAKLLNPKLRRAAILRSDKPLPLSRVELERNTGVTITETIASQPSEWPKQLAQLMHDNDVLLGIDDPSLYNGETIRSILLTTYRHGKGVIGPSRAFVTAGSLASCYTPPQQYLQQLLTMVAASIEEHKLPRPQYPQQFRVVVNSQVAASLGLIIPNEETLAAWSQNYRGDCGDGC